MKKFALIAAATAASFGVSATSAFADATPTQFLKVKLTSSKAGTTKKPTAIGITIDTGTSNHTDTPATSKFTITNAKITVPKGIKLNYKAFPACSDAATCADSAPDSQIGSGSAKAELIGFDYSPEGQLTPFIGTNSQLFIRTQFDKPALIDQPLTGKVSTKSGGYVFDIDVPVSLQTPLAGADQQLNDFNLKFDKMSVKKGSKKINLIELTSCPKSKKYVFKGDFTFKDGSTASAEASVKCSAKK